MNGNCIVLLSGGLDSTAAALWALETYGNTLAVTYSYGQNASNEPDVAKRICSQHGIDWIGCSLGTSVNKPWAYAGRRPDGRSNAIMPARNLIMLAAATGEGATRWSDRSFDLIVGWNSHDQNAFPDCGRSFREVARVACGTAIGVCIGLKTPWMHSTKAEIISWAQGNGFLETLRKTVSCYNGTRCGVCNACVERASAFKEAGIQDGPLAPWL